MHNVNRTIMFNIWSQPYSTSTLIVQLIKWKIQIVEIPLEFGQNKFNPAWIILLTQLPKLNFIPFSFNIPQSQAWSKSCVKTFRLKFMWKSHNEATVKQISLLCYSAKHTETVWIVSEFLMLCCSLSMER